MELKLDKAIKIGKDQARRVLKNRANPPAIEGRPAQAKLNALKASQPMTLVAEGDSWFDYPFNDILKCLEDYYGYEIESVAHKGDTIEGMAYSGGQLDDFVRKIEKLLKRNIIPKAILISGGGNDVAGDEFKVVLNHMNSTLPGLNKNILAGMLEQVQLAYATIFSAVTHICKAKVGGIIPILVHGYDYPIPDGRGVGRVSFLPGPWLEPGFRRKGYEAMNLRTAIIKELIDKFNTTLQDMIKIVDFLHVKFVDLRNTLSGKKDYKKDWANELHPSQLGFIKVSAKFAAVLKGL